MKNKILGLVLAGVMAFSALAFADSYDMAYKKFPDEAPLLAAASVASGDYIPVWDASANRLSKLDATVNAGNAIRYVFDAVANGQTSKTATLTGVTASSRCVASAAEVATNAVYVRAAVPGTDQVVVTVSADPGASNLDFTVICVN